MFRHSSFEYEVSQGLDHVLAVQSASNDDGQTFPGILIDYSEHPKGFSVMSTIHDEIIGPYMVLVFRSHSDTGAIVQPQPASLRLFLRDLQPLPSPNPLNPLIVDLPADATKKISDHAVAVTAKPSGQCNDGSRQDVFV